MIELGCHGVVVTGLTKSVNKLNDRESHHCIQGKVVRATKLTKSDGSEEPLKIADGM
jgi:hypothetical protein